MAQFDPRRQPVRLTPHLGAVCAAVLVASVVWRVYQPMEAAAETPTMTPAQLSQLETQAITHASRKSCNG